MLRRILLLIVLATTALAGCTTLKKWFGGKSKKENVNPPAELVEFSPTVKIRELWSTSLGDGEGRLGLRQKPALADSRVYAADDEGRVYALDAGSGKQLWETETELSLSGGPGTGEGVVVVGGLDGEVIAFDAQSGAEKWKSKITSEVISTPQIASGLVIVRANDGRTFGLDLADGKRKWVYDQPVPTLTVRGNASPIVVDGSFIYLGYDTGSVVALSLADGLRVWEQTVAQPEGRTELDRMNDVDGDLVVADGVIYATSFKGQTVALSAADGRPLWNRDLGSYAGLGLAGERLIAADTAGAVYALDRSGGEAVWKQDKLGWRWLSTPAVQGDYAVVGDLEGYLHWLKLDTGELAARTRVQKSPILATPQVGADGTLYAVTTEGELAAYRIQ